MPMQHTSAVKGYTYVKEKEEKHIQKIPEKEYERGDPDFVDERTSKYVPKKKPSFLESLFED